MKMNERVGGVVVGRGGGMSGATGVSGGGWPELASARGES